MKTISKILFYGPMVLLSLILVGFVLVGLIKAHSYLFLAVFILLLTFTLGAYLMALSNGDGK